MIQKHKNLKRKDTSLTEHKICELLTEFPFSQFSRYGESSVPCVQLWTPVFVSFSVIESIQGTEVCNKRPLHDIAWFFFFFRLFKSLRDVPSSKGMRNPLPKVGKVGVSQWFVLLSKVDIRHSGTLLIPFYFFDLHNSKSFHLIRVKKEKSRVEKSNPCPIIL